MPKKNSNICGINLEGMSTGDLLALRSDLNKEINRRSGDINEIKLNDIKNLYNDFVKNDQKKVVYFDKFVPMLNEKYGHDFTQESLINFLKKSVFDKLISVSIIPGREMTAFTLD